MTKGVRVLVVDDSALMRQMVSRFLTEAGFTVVGTAANGRLGLEKALALRPDVITLDVEMPEMNGLDMLRLLMAQAPTPVVMLSGLTQAQAPAAVEALALGAVDVVAKPGGAAISLQLGDVRDELVQKVAAAARSRPRGGALPSRPYPRPVQTPGKAAGPEAGGPAGSGPAGAPPVGVIVIGCSTGGPGALSVVIPQLPQDYPWTVLVVQHMPPGFTASLARRLDDMSAVPVQEAQDRVKPGAGEVWIAPGGRHLIMDAAGVLRLTEDPPVHGVRPAVDLTLVSTAAVWRRRVVAVIMTGMGRDGARGAEAVKAAGGRVLAQDEASSVVFGMPRVVIEQGLADEVLSLDDMAQALACLEAPGVPAGGGRCVQA